MWLRQSTAGQEILLGPFLDSTDGNTTETGLTIANTDIKLWKEGATTEANKNSGGATHIAGGRYYAVLDATDSNTLGKLEVNVHVSGALAVRREYMVLPAMVYDSLVLGTDRFDVNVTHIGDTAQTANDNGADINAILVDTAEIGSAGAGLTALATAAELAKVPKSDGTVSWNATALAAINAEADTALSDYDAPTKTEMDSAFTEIKGATWSGSTDTLEHIRNKQTDIEADTNELQGDWANGGRLDLILDELTAQGDTNESLLSGLNDIAAADVLTQVNAALDTAISELGVGAPTATPTLRTGLMLLYMMARNRVDVDTTGTDAMKIYNDAGTQIASKLITDDGADYSEAEMS